MTTKYYRVVKEHPAWEIGAVLVSEEAKKRYSPLNDIWDKHESSNGWVEGAELVEVSDWFERVYPIGKLEKMVFGTKEQARKAIESFYKGK